MLDWLLSGLKGVGVEIPKDLSLKSIVTFFLQLMGISWPRIRKLLAKHIGEENIALIEKAWSIISTLIEQGPEGIFEMIKDKLDPKNILDMVLQVAKEADVTMELSAGRGDLGFGSSLAATTAFLKSPEAALTLSRAKGFAEWGRALNEGKGDGKRHLVFAPAKYLSNKQLLEHGVDYAPLPFALYREG